MRFAIAPMAEAISALRVYASPDHPGPHRRWVSSLRAGAPDPSVDLLIDLVPDVGYSPDFLTPPLSTPLGDFEAELAAVRGTPDEVVRAELELTFAERPMPPRIQRLPPDPATHLDADAER